MLRRSSLAVVCSLITAFGQQHVSVRGELQVVSNAPDATYRIELVEGIHQSVIEQTSVRGNGSFEFRSVPEGNYRVRVLRGSDTLREEYIQASRFSPTLFIRVNDDTTPPANSRAGGVVSLRTLQHKPDKKASKLFKESDKLMRENKLDESIAKLREAVAIDPQYMEAHNNLGSRLVHARRPIEALAAFQAAAGIDPNAPAVLANIGVACLQLGRLKDAETAARRALSIDPSSFGAHYIMGVSLAGQKKDLEQALGHLRTAGEKIPQARLAVAQVLVSSGSIDQAREELRSYLASGQTDKRAEVQDWLNRLR